MTDDHRRYFELTDRPEAASLDDATAADLDLEGVLVRVDSTRTLAGRSVLHAWLRTPCEDAGRLGERRVLVDWLKGDEAARRRLTEGLNRLGREGSEGLADLLWGEPGPSFLGRAPAVRWLTLAELAVAAWSLTLGLGAVAVFLVLFGANLAVYLKTTKTIGRTTRPVAALAKLLMTARRLAAEKSFGPCRAELAEAGALAEKIPFALAHLLASTNPVGDLVSAVFEYYRIFLLGELRAHLAFEKFFAARREDAQRAFELVGRLDASLALADLELFEDGLAVPELTDAPGLEAADLVHPLVEGFVPLTFGFDRGAVVTGTNMAGKSTFLRTLGVNQVLATSFGLVFAGRFRSSFARVLTALEITDDLASGKSRYLAQAERILAVVEACQGGRVFALIDEILSGTNSADRIRASVGILKHLAGTQALVVASTHDREIAEAVEGPYAALYFCEQLGPGGLAFDYRIQQGIVDRTNAVRLLEHLGFGRYLNL